MATDLYTVPTEAEVLRECQDAIGYQFRDPDLLRWALTHTSGANTRQMSNERMEFLGDSVLGLVACEQLYRRFPDFQEGDLTKVKSVVVSRRVCARISRELNLGDFLFMGKGMMDHRGDVPSNMLADVFESLVAALYLDGGLDVAKPFILKYLDPEIDEVVGTTLGGNSKSVLQQMAQREYGDTPRYVLLDEQGPDHNKCFKVAAEIAGRCFPAAWGKNKKEAELKAAWNAIADMRHEDPPYCTD